MAKTLEQRAKEKKARLLRDPFYESKIIRHLASIDNPNISLCGKNLRLKLFKIVIRNEWNNLEEKYKCKSCAKII